MIYVALIVFIGLYLNVVSSAEKIIYGCEGRGDANDPYLSRFTLLKSKKLKIYFHKFHRSDADDLHDHPWNFVSIILWRGYNECTLNGGRNGLGKRTTNKKRCYPGMILYRPATWVHRVELIKEKPAYTLVFTGDYVRYWGFIVDKGWQAFTEYFKENGC